MIGQSIWSDALIAQLRQLWTSGLSTAKIAREMGISKNAVVGKAHRLGLDARESPLNINVVVSQYDREKVRSLLKSGASKSQVRALTGVSDGFIRTLRKNLTEEGVVLTTVFAIQRKAPPNRKQTTEQDEAQIRALHRNHRSYGAIEGITGFSKDVIRRVLEKKKVQEPPKAPKVPSVAREPLVVRLVPVVSRFHTCQWLKGERPRWRFCDAPAVIGPEGASWCQEHRDLVYVPGTIRRREAA